jgi:hypothetical protein
MFQGMQGIAGDEQTISLTLYTDSYVVRGTIRTRHRRITDILNQAEHDFIVLHDTVLDEYGSRTPAIRSEYAQVNLGSVLFAVSEEHVDPAPELRMPKVAEHAIVSIPPFRITGRIHLLPERNLRVALEELIGRFIPVTEAAYWSDTVGEARQVAPILAFNHSRAHILAPHREVDPWEGLDRSAAEGGRAPDAIGEVPTDVASTSTAPGVQDPWGGQVAARDAAAGGGGAAPAGDPWRDLPSGGATAGESEPAPGNPWGGPGGDPWGAGRRRDEPET